MRSWLPAIVPFIWLTTASVKGQERPPQSDLLSKMSVAVRAAVALAEPSVVTIETIGGTRARLGDFLARGSAFRVGEGPTTGLIVWSDGLVLSSSFNFVRDPSAITVELRDGRRLVAKLLGRNRVLKLALLKVEASELPVAEWAPADGVRVGQTAIALGRGFGTADSAISVGIVSAIGRMAGYALQTDARLSPANYGGPLLDLDGRVLGLCVPMALQPGELAGVEWYDAGIGFAIPRSVVRKNIELLGRGVDVERGFIGIEMADTRAPGVLVRRLAVGSPAAEVGVLAGDHIVEINGSRVMSRLDLLRSLNVRSAGQTIRMVVRRKGNKLEFALTLARRSDIEFGVTEEKPDIPSPASRPSGGPSDLGK